jgi:hypothetical protein
MLHKTKKSRSAIPGYTLIPEGDHFKVRKIGMTKDRVKTDPAYKITRLHNEAFKKAASFGKLIRAALLPGTGIKNKPGPLTAALLKVLSDNIEPYYLRSFDRTGFRSIKNFNLNPDIDWKDSMNFEVDMTIATQRQSYSIHIPGFMPSEHVKAPEGITHTRIIASVVFIDLENEVFQKHQVKTTILPLKKRVVDPVGGVL